MLSNVPTYRQGPKEGIGLLRANKISSQKENATRKCLEYYIEKMYQHVTKCIRMLPNFLPKENAARNLQGMFG